MSGIWRTVDNSPMKKTLSFFEPNKLECLTFRSNSISILQEVTFMHSFQQKQLVSFDFSNNNMISFTGAFDQAITEEGLRVDSLLLSGNKLGLDLQNDDNNLVFKYFTELTRLDLSSNDIKTLPQSIFANLSGLKYLNLSMNSLLIVNFRVSHMTNLQNLDVSENLISQLDDEVQMELNSVSSSSPNFTVNMLGNPFQCSCETRSFLWWMYHKRSMFSLFETTHAFTMVMVVKFANLTQLLQTMDFQCSEKSYHQSFSRSSGIPHFCDSHLGVLIPSQMGCQVLLSEIRHEQESLSRAWRVWRRIWIWRLRVVPQRWSGLGLEWTSRESRFFTRQHGNWWPA